ncbi:hypothetical protein ACO0SA_002877 [Hanseniaspora valbyensis]
MGNCLSCWKSNTHEENEHGVLEQQPLLNGTGAYISNEQQNNGSNLANENSNNSSSLPINDNEREAVSLLLQYLEDKERYDFYTGGPLEALTTLSYSDNINLRRSAALAFAEITEKFVRAVSKEVIEPILALLTDPKNSKDDQIKIATCAALGNFAVNDSNKKLIVAMGCLNPLVEQMLSSDVELQCNAVGCITNLATIDENKFKIAKSGALIPLIQLAKSNHTRVQRNSTGALLNMTHSVETRRELINVGAIPVLITLLNSSDADVQYYCTTALSNIAVDEENRNRMQATEPDLVPSLIKLMDSKASRVKCQAILALRNLASDPSYQLSIVRFGGLSHLFNLIQSGSIPVVLASVACMRNISIHPQNEALIIKNGFLEPLINLLNFKESEEIQCHAISALRNLAAASPKTRLAFFDLGCVKECCLLANSSQESVQSEISATFAILALDEVTKLKLLKETLILEVLIPMTFISNTEVSGNAAATLANLCSRLNAYDNGSNGEGAAINDNYDYYEKVLSAWESPQDGIVGFLQRFLTSEYLTFEHIALWTILQLADSEDERFINLLKSNHDIINNVKRLNKQNYEITLKHNQEENQEREEEEENRYDAALELHGLSQQILELLGK